MKIRLLKPHGNFKAGHEWDCPWRALAERLIADGAASRLEDLPAAKPPEQTRRHRRK